jgi:ribosomal protein S18 acetylase RimI-like enzyme
LVKPKNILQISLGIAYDHDKGKPNCAGWRKRHLNQFISSYGLSSQQLQEIRDLEAACRRPGALNLKLNWDMLEKRVENEINDFLCYADQDLIGFLGLYLLGSQIEITGMVHPDYRRSGIFREMFHAARQECQKKGFGRILIVTEHASEAGIGFARQTGARYDFSEYRMRFAEKTVPDFPSRGITLHRATPEDIAELVSLDTEAFGLPETGDNCESLLENRYDSTYVAKLDGQTFGKIAALTDGESSYIFGFVIKPEMRRRGYGKEVLGLMLRKLLAEGKNSVILEVAVANERALSLYQSCGFKEVTVYDYYELDPTK